MTRIACLTLLCAVALAGTAFAHSRSQSHSRWVVDGKTLYGVVTLTARDITRLPEAAQNADLQKIAIDHVTRTIAVKDAQGPCFPAGRIAPLMSEPGYLRLSVAYACRTVPTQLSIGVLREVAASHLHLAQLRWGDTGREQELLFTAADPHHQIGNHVEELQPDQKPPGNFTSWLRLGAEHIASGYDHLAFLLALLIGVSGWRQVLLIVTGFTLGHSLTLSLATLGWVTTEGPAIEALIGFTIALVAMENLDSDQQLARPLAVAAVLGLLSLLVFRSSMPPLLPAGLAVFTGCYLLLTRQLGPRAATLRPALAVLFGLIHGFGFAGVLSQMGIPDGRLVQALFGFNLGVELGQLALVLTAAAVAILMGRWVSLQVRAWGAAIASTALLALGLFWFISRVVAQA